MEGKPQESKVDLQPSADPPAPHLTSNQSVEHCCVCKQPIQHPIVILLCGHKYHSQCIIAWIVKQATNDLPRNCPMDKWDIGEQVIFDGVKIEVKSILEQHNVVVRSRDDHESDDDYGRAESDDEDYRRAPSYSRSRSRDRGYQRIYEENVVRARPDLEELRRDLIRQGRRRGHCVLCLMPEPTKTLVKKKCPTVGCRKKVPQHVECLAERGDVNGQTYCFECDQRMDDEENENDRRLFERSSSQSSSQSSSEQSLSSESSVRSSELASSNSEVRSQRQTRNRTRHQRTQRGAARGRRSQAPPRKPSFSENQSDQEYKESPPRGRKPTTKR